MASASGESCPSTVTVSIRTSSAGWVIPNRFADFAGRSFPWLAELSLKSGQVPERIFVITIPCESRSSTQWNQTHG
jgi:hypothetical protein